jgi:hypothetical protein
MCKEFAEQKKEIRKEFATQDTKWESRLTVESQKDEQESRLKALKS